ncbi:hypothetical protein KIN20_023666 [Parelaphostrongylus tenuis]|uniref:Uncharacterized protein n=1 Tax=Parelaphostrongylus tenuis TaxID=148309 RepID=A0AAD5N6S7_PARTN|nr:hypothetical protein KIN20_023666 [Parelaphostrongylus tenuis]
MCKTFTSCGTRTHTSLYPRPHALIRCTTEAHLIQPSAACLGECELCFPGLKFDDQAQFARHLRLAHATKEGGSYICRYGENNVCKKLPLEGVSDDDYEAHVRRIHCVSLLQLRHNVHHCEKEFTLSRFVCFRYLKQKV